MLSKRTLHIRPSPVCNLKCPYCFSIDRRKGKIREFPLDMVDWVIDRYKFKEFIMLCGEGETTLCPNFEELVDKCLKYPVPQVQILTHGKGRSLEWWKEFIDKRRENNLGIGMTWHPGQDNLERCIQIADYVRQYKAGQRLFWYIKVVVTMANLKEVLEELSKMRLDMQQEIYFHFDYTNRAEEQEVLQVLHKVLGLHRRYVHVEVCGDSRYLSDVNADSVAITLGETLKIIDRGPNWEDTLLYEEIL